MASTAYQGKDGKVAAGGSDVADVTDWSFQMKSNNPAYASSSTGGYKTRKAGVKDGTGSLSFKCDGTQLVSLAVGTAVTLTLYMDASNTITVPAIVEDLSVDVNISEGDVVSGKMSFGITGAWS